MNGIVNIGKITKEQSITAYKKNRREKEIESGNYGRSYGKVHTSAKDYNRRTEKNVNRYID
jgi:hypothetical protein